MEVCWAEWGHRDNNDVIYGIVDSAVVLGQCWVGADKMTGK